MMKLALLFIVSVLLLSASRRPYCASEPNQTVSGISTSMPKMSVENSQIYLGESILLKFRMPHPKFLGIIGPDGKFFYIVFPESESMGKLTPLIDSKVFTHLDQLEISTSDFKADPYTYGVLENQAVFTKTGAYIFMLGDDLLVDDPSAICRVKVMYKHRLRIPSQIVAFN
jgi:hypothetical protein